MLKIVQGWCQNMVLRLPQTRWFVLAGTYRMQRQLRGCRVVFRKLVSGELSCHMWMMMVRGGGREDKCCRITSALSCVCCSSARCHAGSNEGRPLASCSLVPPNDDPKTNTSVSLRSGSLCCWLGLRHPLRFFSYAMLNWINSRPPLQTLRI